MKHLTLSSTLKELIESQLTLGYDKRDVRVSLQKHFSRMDTSTHRDHFVLTDEIYNIYFKIEERKYKLKNNLFESIEAWLENLRNDGYSTYKSPCFCTSYSFCFLSCWQKDLLLQSNNFCLDATHNTTNIEKGIWYWLSCCFLFHEGSFS
ncbi:hypothetical protein BDF21DRAFT_483537 [Thamnidium elegans]|nr:hypothetical protein BDF21DRAFT_483537 [Thamnidium elegans]